MEIKIDDMIINYEKVGSGQPVILMHGWGQNVEMMYTIVGALKDNYEVYNIDLPGHGQSDEPPRPYTIYDYTTFLEEFIKLNKINNPIIIGHSFGCRIAIVYASRNTNLDKMVLTGAAGIMPKRSLLYYFRVYSYKFFKSFKNVPFVKYYVQEMIDNSGSDDYRNSSPIMKEVLKNTVNEDLTNLLTEVKVPVLLIFGSNDDATPVYMGEEMAQKMQDAQLLVYEGASHYAYLERVVEFNNDMLKFLEEGAK